MLYSIVAVTALAAGVSATGIAPPVVHKNTTTVEHPVYETKVVTSFTTYCPSPTTVVHNKKTYTVTKAQTLTITDCPCTVTYLPTTKVTETHVPTTKVTETHVPTVTKATETHVPTVTKATETHVSTSTKAVETHVPTVTKSVETHVPSVFPNATNPITTIPGVAAPSVAVPTTTAPPPFTGAANKAFAASGAGLAGLVGLAAYLL